MLHNLAPLPDLQPDKSLYHLHRRVADLDDLVHGQLPDLVRHQPQSDNAAGVANLDFLRAPVAFRRSLGLLDGHDLHEQVHPLAVRVHFRNLRELHGLQQVLALHDVVPDRLFDHVAHRDLHRPGLELQELLRPRGVERGQVLRLRPLRGQAVGLEPVLEHVGELDPRVPLLGREHDALPAGLGALHRDHVRQGDVAHVDHRAAELAAVGLHRAVQHGLDEGLGLAPRAVAQHGADHEGGADRHQGHVLGPGHKLPGLLLR
mmetsp:Transcript_117027/g.331578  ORF Transcript_117027/g.331578 Transcript_117027/m.331578 type:complete len:261 (+) Transcript_117027:250-1032(+)